MANEQWVDGEPRDAGAAGAANEAAHADRLRHQVEYLRELGDLLLQRRTPSVLAMMGDALLGIARTFEIEWNERLKKLERESPR